jgi:hypothetical protein
MASLRAGPARLLALFLGYSLLNTEGILEWHQNLSGMAREAVEEGYEEGRMLEWIAG